MAHLDSLENVRPSELILALGRTTSVHELITKVQEPLVGLGQPTLGLGGCVLKGEDGYETDDEGDEAFDDIDEAPAAEAPGVVEPADAIGEDAGEGTRSDRSANSNGCQESLTRHRPSSKSRSSSGSDSGCTRWSRCRCTQGTCQLRRLQELKSAYFGPKVRALTDPQSKPGGTVAAATGTDKDTTDAHQKGGQNEPRTKPLD
jgi:hypothetical protein